MARKRRSKLFVPRARINLALGTLADNTVIGAVCSDTLDEEAFLISCDLTWAILDGTAGEGPIEVGVAHSDYSDAEIEEWLENTGSWDRGDLVSQEISRRKIRQVGVFNGLVPEEVLNDGKPIRTRCKWGLITGQSLKIWAYNRSAAALAGGAQIKVDGNCYFRPK